MEDYTAAQVLLTSLSGGPFISGTSFATYKLGQALKEQKKPIFKLKPIPPQPKLSLQLKEPAAIKVKASKTKASQGAIKLQLPKAEAETTDGTVAGATAATDAVPAPSTEGAAELRPKKRRKPDVNGQEPKVIEKPSQIALPEAAAAVPSKAKGVGRKKKKKKGKAVGVVKAENGVPRQQKGKGAVLIKPENPPTQQKKGKGVGSAKGESASVQVHKSPTTISLKELIDAGLIKVGKKNITVVYKGVTYTAGLTDTGAIAFEGEQYTSPSAFSLHVKKRQTPRIQGDDGWKSVQVDGVPLDEYRKKYYAQPRVVPGVVGVLGVPGVVEEILVGSDDEDALHWVQCTRCNEWRIVPDESWDVVHSMGNRPWRCEDATWDVTTQVPHTAPCKVKKK